MTMMDTESLNTDMHAKAKRAPQSTEAPTSIMFLNDRNVAMSRARTRNMDRETARMLS